MNWKLILIGVLVFGIIIVFVSSNINIIELFSEEEEGIIQRSANQPDDRPVGYEVLGGGKALHIWNEKDDYYFNITSGIQFTNHYEEYWSRNIFCGGFKIDGSWKYYCNDELPFTWSIEHDNETFVNITGYKDVIRTIGGKDYEVRFVLRYSLVNNATELSIIPYAKNIGENDIPVDMGFAWYVRDIRIGMNYNGNMIRTNFTEYNMNDNLDLTFTSNDGVDVAIMYNNITGNHMAYSWNPNTNFIYKIKSQIGQVNAPTTLLINAGTLDIGQEKRTILKWIDNGGCTWICTRIPTTQQDIFLDETYSQGGGITYSGTCTGTASVEFQLDYPVLGTKINTTTNLSMTAINPQVLLRCAFGTCNAITRTVTADEDGLYSIRNKCIFNSQTKFSTGTIINVTISPDFDPPNITLLEPKDEGIFNTSAFNFTCFVEDETGLDQVFWWGNWSNEWHILDVNNSPVNNMNHTLRWDIRNDFLNTTTINTNTFGAASPTGVDWNGTHTWVVTTSPDRRVILINSSNQHIFNFSLAGLSLSRGITNNGSNLLITDEITRRIYNYNYTGEQNSFCVFGPAAGMMDIDSNGSHNFLADAGENIIFTLNTTCGHLSNFSTGSAGTEAVETNGSLIWAPDTNNFHMKVFDMVGNLLTDQRMFAPVNVMSSNVTFGGIMSEVRSIRNTQDLLFESTSTGPGTYVWNCEAVDTAPTSNQGFADANFTLTVNDIFEAPPAECWVCIDSTCEIPIGCILEVTGLFDI